MAGWDIGGDRERQRLKHLAQPLEGGRAEVQRVTDSMIDGGSE